MAKALKPPQKDEPLGGLARVGKLDTLANVRAEMARVYRLAASAKVTPEDMTKFIYALKEMRCCIEANTMASELADIQRRIAALAGGPHGRG